MKKYLLILLSVLNTTQRVIAFPSQSSSSKNKVGDGPILIVGATGGTGVRALQGLLDVGYKPSQMRLLTRNPNKLKPLIQKFGFQTCKIDLDDCSSNELKEALVDCVGCYIHSTSSDTTTLDTLEEARARTLAKAIKESSPDCHVVYNSAAGEPEHGVKRIQQKQDVEKVFFKEFKGVPFTSLRANLFMEELWKKYTRPAILNGKFPFSVPPDRQIYLVSVRDMGKLAGTCIANEIEIGNVINVAGDVLSAQQMASAFTAAQETPCKHSQAKIFGFLSRFISRDMYQQIRFYRMSSETTDIVELATKFQGILTDFPSFLKETEWENEELTFDNFKNDAETLLVVK